MRSSAPGWRWRTRWSASVAAPTTWSSSAGPRPRLTPGAERPVAAPVGRRRRDGGVWRVRAGSGTLPPAPVSVRPVSRPAPRASGWTSTPAPVSQITWGRGAAPGRRPGRTGTVNRPPGSSLTSSHTGERPSSSPSSPSSPFFWQFSAGFSSGGFTTSELS